MGTPSKLIKPMGIHKGGRGVTIRRNAGAIYCGGLYSEEVLQLIFWDLLSGCGGYKANEFYWPDLGPYIQGGGVIFNLEVYGVQRPLREQFNFMD